MQHALGGDITLEGEALADDGGFAAIEQESRPGAVTSTALGVALAIVCVAAVDEVLVDGIIFGFAEYIGPSV
jgi:hypothetical protein